MRLQNTTEHEVTDFLTQQSAAPGEIIEVDDSLEENYEGHPVWDRLPDGKTKVVRKQAGDKNKGAE